MLTKIKSIIWKNNTSGVLNTKYHVQEKPNLYRQGVGSKNKKKIKLLIIKKFKQHEIGC